MTKPTTYEQMHLGAQFMANRRVSTPIVQVNTPDPASAIHTIVKAIDDARTKQTKPSPVYQWDIVRGLMTLNDDAANVTTIDPEKCIDPVEMLREVGGVNGDGTNKLPERSVVFVHNAHLLIQPSPEHKGIEFIQGIWALRDLFKQDRRMLVLLTPGARLPQELENDVMVLDDPLPDDDALRALASRLCEGVGIDAEPELIEQCVDAMAGIAAFPAEQIMAMSIDVKAGTVDVPSLWHRKKQLLDQTPGLSIWGGDSSFADVAGYRNVIDFTERFITRHDTQLVVWIDEIEKALYGAEGESNGIIMDQVSMLLTFMQDNNVPAMLFLGFPGSGKSQIAKSTGRLTVQLDLGGMLGGIVGESQGRIRNALATIQAVSRGKVLFVATCNSVSSLRTELLRRFRTAKFFFDLPNEEERKAIWKLYLDRHPELQGQALPEHAGWSGANIEECVEKADQLGYTLHEAAAYVVPEANSSASVLNELRQQAEGVWISATETGFYRQRSSVKKAHGRIRDIEGAVISKEVGQA